LALCSSRIAFIAASIICSVIAASPLIAASIQPWRYWLGLCSNNCPTLDLGFAASVCADGNTSKAAARWLSLLHPAAWAAKCEHGETATR
jgi:hypothetical protein